MAPFLLTIISLLAIFYVINLTKYKFKNESREKIKKLHSIVSLTLLSPFIAIILIQLLEYPVIVISTLFLSIVIIYITIFYK